MKNLFGSKSRIALFALLMFSIISITNSCKKASDVPGTNEVFIQGMAFSPSSITVTSGTTITWTNKDGVAHTVTSNTGVFDSGTINASRTYSHMFSTAGSFPYHCIVHPSMTATVIVN
jgi:plastocyanin